MACPRVTLSPSLTLSWTIVPPMRPRAGTTLMLSTVANTAFSSATVRGATVSVSAQASGALIMIVAAKAAINVIPRIVCTRSPI